MPGPIAIACSDRQALTAWSAALTQAGYEVLTFGDSMQALEALEAQPGVRILVTCIDFGPGKPNGITLARVLRNKRRDLRVIFLAARNLSDHAEGLGELKVFPVHEAELLEAIHKLAQGDSSTLH